MNLKILKSLVMVLMFSRISSQDTPEDRCEMSGSGSVCIDCLTSGKCVANEDGTYAVEFDINCPNYPSQSYCDDTLSNPENFGTCFRLPLSYTNCSCSSNTQCMADVNNPAVVLHCESSPPVTDPPCSNSILNLTTCGCASCSDSCPFLDDPNDDCASYFVCNGDNLIPINCAQDLCFDQKLCSCAVRGETTTELSTTTTEQIPPECNFLDDPNDDCSSYFVLDGTILIQAKCTGTLCYDPEACACVEREPTTTETILTCPEDCPFVDDPKGVCASYFLCSGTDLIPVNCTGGLCFDQASCACVENGGTSKSTTTTQLTCSSDCPFVDNPNSCESYYLCNGDDLIAVNCSQNFCFNQESCACVEKS